MAKEAFGAAEMAAYEHGVLETEIRLVEEVAGVCRDYCTEVWEEALNRAGVPTDFELRRAGNIYFPEDIREVPAMLPPSVAGLLLPLEQFSTIQTPSPDTEISTGADKGKKV